MNILYSVVNVYSELKTSLYTMSQVLDDCDNIPWCEITINNRELVVIDIYYNDISITIDCGDTYNCYNNDMCKFEYCSKLYECKFNDLPSEIIDFLINASN